MEGGGKKREEEEVNNVAHWLVKSGKVQKHQKLRQKKNPAVQDHFCCPALANTKGN